MKALGRATTVVAFFSAALATEPALAQGGPNTPDSLFIRLNGTQKLTQVLLPRFASQSGQTSQEIAEVPILTEKRLVAYLDLPGVGLKGFGVIVDTWLSDVDLDAPIDGNGVTASFWPPSGDADGHLSTSYDLKDARIRFDLHVRMRPEASGTPIPKEALSRLSFHHAIGVEVKRFYGAIYLNLAHQGHGIRVASASGFVLQLGDVELTNPGLLLKAADLVLGFDRLFNIVGASNSKQAVTKITNRLLSTVFAIDGDLKSMMNSALAAISTQGFPQQELALQNGGLMLFNAQFAGFSTVENNAVTGWSVQLDARPNDKVPGLAYTKLARANENIAEVDPQDDAQVFIPYSMIDLAFYEAIQAGLSHSIPVPDVDGPGPLRAFTMNLIPNSVPRVRQDRGNSSNLLLEFGVRMEDVTVGRVTTPVNVGDYPSPVSPPKIDVPTDIYFVNGTADARLHLRLGVNAKSGVNVSVTRVDLLGLTGQLRFATTTASISSYRAKIENAINRRLGPNPLPLMPQTMPLTADLAVAVGTPASGSQYARIPLTIIAKPLLISVPALKKTSP